MDKIKKGKALVYGNRTFRKGGDDEKDEEERLLKQLVTVANAKNKIKMKREVLVATVGRKEDWGETARIRVRVRVDETEEGAEPAKKEAYWSRGGFVLLGTDLSFLRWEALADNNAMKYGSRCYIKGVPKSEEKLFGHIVRTLEENA